MSEAKFTKGEWEVKSTSLHPARIKVKDKKGMEGKIIGDVRNRSNADLIAAAPEMYAMLEVCLSEMHGLIDEVNDQRASRITSTTESEPDYHDQETLHLIQLLLAKVRGEHV